MTTQIMRGIVKGHIAGAVAWRGMFTGEVEVVSPDTDQQPVQGYIDRIYAHVISYLSTLVTMDTIQIQEWFGGHWTDRREVVYGNYGTSSSEMLPNAVAVVLIGKAIGLRLIGRKFFPGITESYVNGNLLTGAAVAGFASALADYLTIYTTAAGSTFQPGIVDRTGAFHSFSSGFVSALLGSMRRRKPGLGI